MGEKGNVIWIANHPFWDRAFFLRQEIHRVLLTSPVKALLNLAGASLWIAETEGSDSAPKQWDRLPDRYTDALLYHVRKGRLIQKEEIFGFQGIHSGDVLVLFRGDSELLGIQAELIQRNPAFPVYIPVDLSGHAALVTAAELLGVARGRGPDRDREKETASQEIVFLGDPEQAAGGKGAEIPGGPEVAAATLVEIWAGLEKVVDPDRLALELYGLREAPADGKDGSVGKGDRHRIALAEVAARAGDGVKVVEFLGFAGKRVREAAERQAAGLVLAVMKGAAKRGREG